MSTALVYSTNTGESAVAEDFDFDPIGIFSPAADLLGEDEYAPESSVYCFLCHVPECHLGEHDTQVNNGQAVYAADGSVLTVDLIDGDH